MKRKHINASTLAHNVPPPSPGFAEETMARLRGMAAKEEKPMKRKLSTSILIAALLIALLAATALAIGLRRSAEADAMVRARQALMDDYGLTLETIGCFMFDTRQDGDVWTVTFTGAAWELERLGDYTVRLAPGMPAETSWSHDDVDPALWQGGDMDAPAWGQAQILQRLRIQAQTIKTHAQTDWDNLSFEEAQTLLPNVLLSGANGETLRFDRLVPEETDLPAEDIVDMAREALVAAYGIGTDVLAAFDVEVAFGTPRDGGERQYMVQFYRPWPEQEFFVACIASPSGETLACAWSVSNDRRTLPEGPLGKYAHAVAEFMDAGALETKSAQEKADIARRVTDAGLGALIRPARAYVMPGTQDIPEVDAVAAANEALLSAYGISQDALSLFDVTTSLLDAQPGRVWEIAYSPKAPERWHDWIWDEINEKIGVYTVSLDAGTRNAPRVTWSHEEAWTDGAYTQSTWATAPVYHGSLLHWTQALREAIDAILAKYPPEATEYDYTMEDAAAYDTCYREAGFDARQFSRSMPREGDIPYEEAVFLAREAILAEMPQAGQALGDGEILGEYSLYDPQVPTWRFSWFFTLDGMQMDYGVAIDATTGDVLLTNLITGGNG